jgi:hypothetical protein
MMLSWELELDITKPRTMETGTETRSKPATARSE